MTSSRHLRDASQIASEIETTTPISLPQPKYVSPSGPLTEAEIRATPMAKCHVELAVLHFRHLSKMVWHVAGGDSALQNVHRRIAAREQLARMTLVVRDYMDRLAEQHLTDPCVESMITDLCEASLYGRFSIDGSGTGPLVFANPTLGGREQEIEMQKQVLRAGSADDVTELEYTFDVSADIVPDTSHALGDIAEGIDWNRVLVRSRSEDNIMAVRQYVGFGGAVKKERIQRKLLRTNKSSHLIHWPPVVPFDGDSKLSGPRERTDTDVSDVEHPGPGFRLRTWSNNVRTAARSRAGTRARTMLSGPSEDALTEEAEECDQQAVVAANQQLSRELLSSATLAAEDEGPSPEFPSTPGSPGQIMTNLSPRSDAVANEHQRVEMFDIGLRQRSVDEVGMFIARLDTLLRSVAHAYPALTLGDALDDNDQQAQAATSEHDGIVHPLLPRADTLSISEVREA